MRLRRPWGLRTAQLSPVSVAPGRLNGEVPHADQNEASTALRAANSETVATFVGPGKPKGAGLDADQNEASPALGAANCKTVDTFACFRGAHWRAVLRRSE